MSTIKANNVQHVDATSANIALDSSGNVTLANNLTVDTNTLFVNATNNRVGLGTSSPSTNIEINAALDTGVSLGLNEGQLSVGREANSGGAVRIGYDTTNNFGFISSGRVGTSWDKLILNAGGGNVGIGTTSPSSLLAVHQASASTANYINITNDATGTSSLSNGMLVGVSTSGAALCWQNENLDLLFGTNNTERARIDSSGRVGIGTQTPGELLTVNGNIRIGSDGIISGGSSSNGTRIQGGATFPGGHIILNGGNSSDNIIFNRSGASTSSIETARIDSSGRLLVGTSSAYGSAIIQAVGYAGSAANTGYVSIIHGGNATSGEDVGLLEFRDTRGAFGSIKLAVDGTTGTNDYPGRLVFSTTADGASSPTERMRIINSGFLKVANDGDYASASATYHELNNTTNEATLLIRAKNASLSTFNIRTGCYRAANSAWSVLRAESGDGSTNAFNDIEFNLRGDGNAYADGSWNGGGADYAEYFEWSDGNPDEEDRRGISVVLDGDKIRPAIDGEDPIGVISGNPSVVGDAAWNKWSGKYLRDDYGTYIQEDYEVVNDEGETVIQQRRKLNPAYDPDQEYVNREDRPEWDCVGLMGKLRIRKGQPTGSRWIKMRDISDSVEEWLVR